MKVQRNKYLSISAVLLMVAVQVVSLRTLSSPTHVTAAPLVQAEPLLLAVGALIDGRSWLIIQDNMVHWHHLDYAAPGRHEGADEPTLLNGTPWLPTWPDVPDPENRDCHCDSSTFVGIPPLASEGQTIVLQVIEARGRVAIIQQPDASNAYTLIVEFNDNAPLGSAWYTIELANFASTTLLANPGFEMGKDFWSFFSDSQGYFATTEHALAGNAAAVIHLTNKGKNTQLYQAGFPLEPKTRYQLRFAAYSNSGHDLSVHVHQHNSPYQPYGLRNLRVNLTKRWRFFTIEFTTKAFTSPTTDTRLRFSLAPYAVADDRYWIDEVSLHKVPTGVQAAQQSGVGAVFGAVPGIGAAATVLLTDLETEGTLYQSTVTTDDMGAFRFDLVPFGVYEVQVVPSADYLPPEPVQLLVTEEPNEELTFTLDPVTERIYLPQIVR